MNPALLPLLLAVPLLAAGLLVIVRSRGVQRVVVLAVPAGTLVMAVLLLLEHRSVPVLAHQVGAFAPGVAIPFVSDTLAALMLAVTSLATLVAAWFLCVTGEDRYRFLPALLLMLHGGVNGAFLTGDLFNLFVMVEVMLLPSYALIAVTGTWRRLGIGRTFVVVNLVTSALLLTGVGLVYAVAGTVNLALLSDAAADNPPLALAAAVVLLALSVKGAVVPVHGWLPQTYPATSAGVMALFSALHTKVALYAIYRIYATVFDGHAPWAVVLVVLVVLTLGVGAWSTFGEHIIRRALAWQMIAGVGHILVGLTLFTAASLAAGLFYMLHHIVTMGALLLLAGAIEQVYGSGRYERLSGLIHRDRAVAILTALGLLSLIGIPISSGFFGKVALISAAAATGTWQGWLLLSTVLVVSVLSLVAMQRLWAGVFWGPEMETYRPDSPATGRAALAPLPQDVLIPARLWLPGATLVTVQLGMFFGAGTLMPLVARAAQGLVDTGPYVEAVLR
ncbi:proton-conducting transporter membrane subunit [Ornithinimicrobium cerasi]|uniref:proton-conducting transporter transmembrane domain-containing protein n=1 Tax=Ornithinimicrobium cerasi TaxID=2248773 RepID=UPI000EFFA2DA|nr:proton-conducting transporter membrane subunit [Ornithinimicrobium cerasi]